jgi:hypothetical protein
MKPTMAGRLRHLVRDTRKAAAEEGFHLDIDQLSPGAETDPWEEMDIEVDALSDVTDMVEQALQASGFTGKEKRFRELPR